MNKETCTGPNNEYACLWDGARYLNCTSRECTDPLCDFIGACPCTGCDYSMCHVRIWNGMDLIGPEICGRRPSSEDKPTRRR